MERSAIRVLARKSLAPDFAALQPGYACYCNVREFTGQSLLLGNALPNFYFHATTAYDILRQCGLELGKRDFMGTPPA